MQQEPADPQALKKNAGIVALSFLLSVPEADQHVCACGPDWDADRRPKQKKDDLWALWSAPC